MTIRRCDQSPVLEPGMVLTVDPAVYVDAAREVATFALREYNEVAIRERRDRLGMAVAGTLVQEEHARAPKITHAGSRRIRLRRKGTSVRHG